MRVVGIAVAFVVGAASLIARADRPLPSQFRAGDLEGSAEALERDGAPESLAVAATIRRALDDERAAARDIERLFALARDPARAADAATLLLDEVWGDAASEGDLRRLRARFASTMRPLDRLRTDLGLARLLWRTSCPIRGDDGSCARRTLGRLTWFPKWRRKPGYECAVPPVFEYVVKRRNARSREAQRLVRTVIDGAAVVDRSDARDALVSEALFLDAEPRFEAALALPVPTTAPRFLDYLGTRFGFKVPPRKRRDRHVALFGLESTGPRERPLYQRVSARGVGRWEAAAQARIGQLWLSIEDVATTIPPPPLPKRPKGYPPAEWDALFHEIGCGVGPRDERFSKPAQEAFARCELLAQRGDVDPEIEQLCLAALNHLAPAEYPLAFELY